jgi:purine-cytosine permease-like protein
MDNQRNWWQLSSIQIGGVICLPVIVIGQTLYQTYGFASSIAAILLGNAILLLLGLATTKMSCEKRKTTPLNATEYFGETGVTFFALTMCVSLVGWFAIQLNMMSLSVFDLLALDKNQALPGVLSNLMLGSLITVAALYGIKSINFLSNLSLPLLIITLGYAFFTVEDAPPSAPSVPLSFAGISMVIALAIAFVIDLPTYYRHAKTSKDGFISISIIFVLALPILEIVGVYLAAGSSGGTILDVLKRSNGNFWNLWVALFLILAGWTTNNINLYSGAVCLEPLLKIKSEKLRTLLFGGVGTFLSCFNFLNHLIIVLDVMGIFVASMGSVIITRYLIEQVKKLPVTSNDYPCHFLAWMLGLAMGFSSLNGVSLTSIPVLDATIGSSLGTFFVLIQRKYSEKANIAKLR